MAKLKREKNPVTVNATIQVPAALVLQEEGIQGPVEPVRVHGLMGTRTVTGG